MRANQLAKRLVLRSPLGGVQQFFGAKGWLAARRPGGDSTRAGAACAAEAGAATQAKARQEKARTIDFAMEVGMKSVARATG